MIDPKNKTDWQHTLTTKTNGLIAFRLDHWGLCRTAIGFGKTLDSAIDDAVAKID